MNPLNLTLIKVVSVVIRMGKERSYVERRKAFRSSNVNKFASASSSSDRKRNGEVFNGGDPLKFRSMLPKMRQLFIQNEITDFMNFDTHVAWNLVGELTFDIPLPTELDMVAILCTKSLEEMITTEMKG